MAALPRTIHWHETFRMRAAAAGPEFRREAVRMVLAVAGVFVVIGIVAAAVTLAVGLNGAADWPRVVIVVVPGAGALGLVIGALMVFAPRQHQASGDMVWMRRRNWSGVYDRIEVFDVAVAGAGGAGVRRVRFMHGPNLIHEALADAATADALQELRAEALAKELGRIRQQTAALHAASVQTLRR